MMRLMDLLWKEDGSELIEVAVALPVLLLLLFGIISFGIVMFGWCNITLGSRAAARYASVHSGASLRPATTASVTAVVTPFLVAVQPNGAMTTVTYSLGNMVGSTVTVTVNATYATLIPFTSWQVFAVSSTAQRTITR